jgi:hypothetical protein
MFLKTLALCLLICLTFPSVALAYVDPGSGSLLLQVLIAGILGFAFTARLYWGKLTRFLKRTFLRKEPDQDNQTPNHE